MNLKPLASLAVAVALACAQSPARALDLKQALEAASRQDAQLASARAQLQTVRERVPQAAAGLLPTVSGITNINRQTVDTSSFPRRESTPRQFAISLNQPLLRMDRFETLEQSKLAVAQAEAALEASRQDLIVRVATAYFDILSAGDTLAAVRAQKRAIALQLESAKRNFQVGTATITDQQEAQARADLTDSQEIAAENDLGNKRNALAVLTGRPITEMYTLDGLRSGLALLPPEPAQDEAWTERARSENMSVRQAAIALEVARREITKARFGHWPTIDLVSSASRSENSSIGFPTPVNINSMSVGLQLAVPIYAGGAVTGRVREVVAASEKAVADLEVARRSADLTARQLLRKVTSGLAQVRALEAAERSSQLALDSNLLGYQVGVRINIDVLNAQQQLFSTRRDLALARYTVLVDGLRLRQSVGGLDENDLSSINALLTAFLPAAEAAGTVTGKSTSTSTTPSAAPPAATAPVSVPSVTAVNPQPIDANPPVAIAPVKPGRGAKGKSKP
jgi:outer membrane protein